MKIPKLAMTIMHASFIYIWSLSLPRALAFSFFLLLSCASRLNLWEENASVFLGVAFEKAHLSCRYYVYCVMCAHFRKADSSVQTHHTLSVLTCPVAASIASHLGCTLAKELVLACQMSCCMSPVILIRKNTAPTARGFQAVYVV